MKEGYRNYEFGTIPSDWTIKKLGDIYDDMRTGATPSRNIESYYTGNIPWITSGELKSKYIYETNEEITEEAVKETNLRIYPVGTFFIAITGLEAEGTRGSCAINAIPSTTNQSCLAFIEKKELFTEFLYYWYSLYGDYIGLKYTQGTKQQSLNNKIMEKMEIAYPPLKEQQKIADILSAVDSQIDDTDKLIKNTKELKKGLMQRLLTKGIGHSEFKKSEVGEIPVEWEVINFFDFVKKVIDFRGRTPKKLGLEWGDGDILALSANNVKMGKIDFEAENYLGSSILYNKWMNGNELEKNDILLTMEAPLGNVALVPDDKKYILSQRVIALKTNDNIENKFMLYMLMSDIVQKQLDALSTGTTAKGINQKNLTKVKAIIPPISEQKQIANILSSVDTQIEEYENKKAKLEQLKKGLMQKLLTGKLRVV